MGVQQYPYTCDFELHRKVDVVGEDWASKSDEALKFARTYYNNVIRECHFWLRVCKPARRAVAL